MNILFISRFGDSYGLAIQMAYEGDNISYYIDDVKYRRKGTGIYNPKRINNIPDNLSVYDLILFDMTGLGKLADKLRSKGYPVLGGSELADKLEKERDFAQKLMKKYSPAVSLPDYKKFTNIQDGIKFLESEDTPYCFKPDNMPTAWTFVPRKNDNTSVISIMSLCHQKKLPYILQQKVDGLEISTEGWFNGSDWVDGAFNHTIERKRFMDGDKGPNCGCTGNIIWASGKDELVETLLLPLTTLLRHYKHVGPIDVNAIVSDDEVYFLEFTPRFGYDSIQAASMLMGKKSDWFYQVVSGQDAKLDKGYAIAVRLTMPPYPLSEDNVKSAKDTQGMKVVEVGDHYRSYFPVDVMVDSNEMIMAGTDNVIGTVCATGENISDCRKEAYEIIDDIAITNDIQYRADIGAGDQRTIEKLTNWGWLD